MGNSGAPQDTFTEVVVSSLNLTELGALGAEGESRGALFPPFWKFKALGLVPRNQQGRVGPWTNKKAGFHVREGGRVA